jgi:hypothetical protein
MTKQKTWKGIRICCYVALLFCIAWALFEVFMFVGLLTGKGGVDKAIDWSQENTSAKAVLLVVDILSAIVTIGLCVLAALNFLISSREEIVFPQKNVKVFFWLVLSYFVHRLSWAMHPVYYNHGFSFTAGHSVFVIPFLLLFFAFMYKVAADAVEENNLTI